MNEIENVIKAYLPNEELISCAPLGNGHINSTFLVTTERNQYVLQKINTGIFKNVDGLMENVQAVTHHIRDKARKEGINPARATIHFIPAPDGNRYLHYGNDAYRLYKYIDKAYTIEKMENPESFYYSGIAFGDFAEMLKDFDASQLVETIKNFHNTVSRFKDFEKAVDNDAAGRAADVYEEIKFVKDRESFTSLFVEQLENGSLPLRVTHNDTKLNNIMIDKKTNKALGLIDLDTVMNGSLLYDYGDALRIGASKTQEDEVNLDLVGINYKMFNLFIFNNTFNFF